MSVLIDSLPIKLANYRRTGNLDNLYRRLVDTLDTYGKTYEVLFVDDGSTDRSFAQLDQLYQNQRYISQLRTWLNLSMCAT